MAKPISLPNDASIGDSEEKGGESAPPVNAVDPRTSILKKARQEEAEQDRLLIERAQGGDTVAFRNLVERHQRRAFAIAFSLVRDDNDAKEIVQEAFVRVYKGLKTFQGTSSFFTWLYRIITNLSIDLMRKPGSRLQGELDENQEASEDAAESSFLSRIEGSDPQEVVRRKEIGSALRTALDALPSYHRSVILMREVEGMSYEEMAQAAGVSKGTIMSRLFHARQKLQKSLSEVYVLQIGRVPAPSTSATDGTSDAHTETLGDAPDSDHNLKTGSSNVNALSKKLAKEELG